MPKSDASRALSGTPATNFGTWTTAPTQFGEFRIAALDGFVVLTALPGSSQAEFVAELATRFPGTPFRPSSSDPLLARAVAQVQEYAQRQRTSFDLPVRLEGTAFQQRVWGALSNIPFGEVRSYQDVARDIGRPGASRAVGQANHANPVAPFIPCHRVVNSSGTLGGYGGGMPLKKALLKHEGVQLE